MHVNPSSHSRPRHGQPSLPSGHSWAPLSVKQLATKPITNAKVKLRRMTLEYRLRAASSLIPN